MMHFIVLVLVGAGEASSPAMHAMQAAVEQVLGAGGRVVVDEAPGDVSDAEAIRGMQARDASAVARVRMVTATSGEPRVELRVHRRRAGGSDEWITRVLGFDRGDDLEEIGRAIGYTLLAMLPDLGRPGAAPLHGPLAPDDHPAPRAGAPPTGSDREPALYVDVVGAASTALGGAGERWGGGLRAGWAATPRLRIGAGAVGRSGTIAPAVATASTLGLSIGAALTPIPSRRFSLSLRVEALLSLEMASRPEAGGGTARQWRWLPGGSGAAEAAIWLSPGVAVLLAGGVEAVSGSTDVFVGGVKQGVIPPFRAIAEAGARLRF